MRLVWASVLHRTAPGAPSEPAAAPGWVIIAAVLVTVIVLAIISTALIRRRGRLSSPESAATYRTLHAAAEAARHLRDGLTPRAASRAAKDLRPLLGVTAVAFADPEGLLAWEGQADHHRVQVEAHAAHVLRSGQTVRIGEDQLACTDLDCEVQHAILAPVVSDGRIVAVIGSYHTEVTADLARATEAVAAWVATQLDLAELAATRSRAVEAELRALRAQISPHFIYNSLAAIASFVRTDPSRARELILEFADFTRYALRRSGPFATLSEELNNVERYLMLEQARFGDRLQVCLQVAPEVLSVSVPSLTIQPLVENAVQHGIEAKTGVGLITISAQNFGADAEISIEDDGVGAPPGLMRGLLSGQRGGDHVGLSNVDARLRQTYGDDYGLVVETAEGAGMKVSFRVPKYSPQLHKP